MAHVQLGAIKNNNQPVNFSPRAKEELPAVQQIERQLKARGTQEIGEKAYEKALNQISRMLEGKNVQVSSSFEANTGMVQVTITDGDTGKKIAQLPPDAVVEMAQKAKDRQFGLILDRTA